MKTMTLKQIAIAAAVVTMMGASYGAGLAAGGNAGEVAKLNSTIDFLTKAEALLTSVRLRQGYGNIESAKASIKSAIGETQKAVIANGG